MESQYIRTSQWWECHWRTNISSEEGNNHKRAGMWDSQSRTQEGKITIWERSFEMTSPGLSAVPSE